MREQITNKIVKKDLLVIAKELQAEVFAFETDIINLKEENKLLKLSEKKAKSSAKSKEEKLKTANAKVSKFSKLAEELETERQKVSEDYEILSNKCKLEVADKADLIDSLTKEIVAKDKELRKYSGKSWIETIITSLLGFACTMFMAFGLGLLTLNNLTVGQTFGYSLIFTIPTIVTFIYFSGKWSNFKFKLRRD